MRVLSLFLCALLLAACGGAAPPTPAPPAQPAQPGAGQPTAAQPTTPAQPAAGGLDACALLSDEEILQVTGLPVTSKRPHIEYDGTAGCRWELDAGGDGSAEIQLDVISPGGREAWAYFVDYWAGSEELALGDGALALTRRHIAALKGDTVVQLDYDAFHAGSQDHAPLLLELALGRL